MFQNISVSSVIAYSLEKEFEMKQNIHNVERLLRVIVGVVLILLAFVGLKNPWFLLGFVPLITGILGWCPPYAILGISTCKLKDK